MPASIALGYALCVLPRGLAFVFLLVFAACGAFGEGIDPASANDAGSDATQDGPADGGVLDGGDDGPKRDGSSSCQVVADETFDDMTSNSRWTFLGSAKVSNGELELVPNATNQTGAIWMDVTVPAGSVIRATYRTKIAPAEGADGLAFVWSTTKNPALGGTAGDYGACGGGADGVAVVVESFAEEVRLINVASSCEDKAGPKLDVFSPHALSVVVAPSKVDVAVDGIGYVSAAPPRAVAVQAIGFTAATGGLSSRHAIDDVHIELCTD